MDQQAHVLQLKYQRFHRILENTKKQIHAWINHLVSTGAGPSTPFITLSCAEYYLPDWHSGNILLLQCSPQIARKLECWMSYRPGLKWQNMKYSSCMYAFMACVAHALLTCDRLIDGILIFLHYVRQILGYCKEWHGIFAPTIADLCNLCQMFSF